MVYWNKIHSVWKEQTDNKVLNENTCNHLHLSEKWKSLQKLNIAGEVPQELKSFLLKMHV